MNIFKWARYLYHHELTRDASIRNLEFPYPYREGQRPCGVCLPHDQPEKAAVHPGTDRDRKDASTVFPAVHAIGREKAISCFI